MKLISLQVERSGFRILFAQFAQFAQCTCMRFSKWTEIIFRLIFVTEYQPVTFDEETEVLNIIENKILLQRIKIMYNK
jgi:hypothetical protein